MQEINMHTIHLGIIPKQRFTQLVRENIALKNHAKISGGCAFEDTAYLSISVLSVRALQDIATNVVYALCVTGWVE